MSTSNENGCANSIAALFILAAIYCGGGFLVQYVLGGFGVHISFLLGVATFFLARMIKP